MVIRTLVLSLLFVTSSVLSACAGAVPRELAGCKIIKLWHFDSGAQGWQPDHNVSRFTPKNGILSFRNTGFDPWIINRNPGIADASKCSFIGIKMRSSVTGANQLYFGTRESPILSERQEADCGVLGDGQFHLYELNLGRLKTWKGKITQLRFDIANGGLEKGAKIDVDWIALYQIPPRISLGRPEITRDKTGGRHLVLTMVNDGGERQKPGIFVRANGVAQKCDAVLPGRMAKVGLSIGRRTVAPTAIATFAGKTVFTVGVQPEQVPSRRDKVIRGDFAELAFRGGESPSSAALSGTIDGKRFPAGVFHPLATLVYRDKANALHYLELKADTISVAGDTAVLKARRSVNGGVARLTWTFRLPKGSHEGTMSCALTCGAPIDVLRFEGPRLLAGEGSFGSSKTHALFPGLEYLEKDEPSSSPAFTGPKFADRRIPHPYKITTPVMAVESGGMVVGLSWDPMTNWARGRTLPCAQFESPNKSAGARNHLMTLFAPSIPAYVDENSELAKWPFDLRPGRSMNLSARFFARRGSITDVVPYHLAARGVPKAPPLPHGLEGTVGVCFKGFTESLYSPEKNGWRTIFGFHESPVFRADVAARILAESLRKGDPSIAAKCKIAPDTQLSQFTGSTLDWFSEGSKNAMRAVIAQQAADGGFPYTITDEMREKVKPGAASVGLDSSTLGRVGVTNSGLIAEKINQILQYALSRGDKECADAGLKGLARLNEFTVPRGAQTWEVHADAPDIFAAALAVDCNIAGYHLTGDLAYLEQARFWAYTGIPFVYTWVPPVNPKVNSVVHYDANGEGKSFVLADASEFYHNVERRVTPGATIPVFGTSFYVVKWFGSPVQWCGLVWAQSVRHYLRLKPDPLLASVADAVFASGAQQQMDRGFLAGSYTDVWGIEPIFNSPVFLGPNAICDYAYTLLDEKPAPGIDSFGFGIEGHRACLSSYGLIGGIGFGGSGSGYRGQATLKYYPGQDLYSCLVPVRKPEAVAADGVALAESTDLRNAPSGYYYDEANKALHIKHHPANRISALTMDWRR
ncbi:MAG: hypothetical protein Q7T82_09425 [Armatimonadota bacterium]|nr:hypothetical protein [Armatimonadota bacterium]